MDELTDLLTKIELTADDIIDTKQQIVNLDARRLKGREALNRLQDLRVKHPSTTYRHWVCIGDMFIKLNSNETRNLILEDLYTTDEGVEKLRDDLKEKVGQLNQLEGKPEITGFNLKPLRKEEIVALRTAFRI